jgi:hypothetical protein
MSRRTCQDSGVTFLPHLSACWVLWVATSLGAEDVHAVDFKNFSYRWQTRVGGVPSSWRWLPQSQNSDIRLLDGVHRFQESGEPMLGSPYLMFWSVAFGDLTGDGRDEAAVDLIYSTGGTANWHYLYVYTTADGSPELLGILRSGSRADGGLVRATIQRRLLVLDFADTNRRMADCCSKGWVRVAYRWQDSHFAESGSRTYGDFK